MLCEARRCLLAISFLVNLCGFGRVVAQAGSSSIAPKEPSYSLYGAPDAILSIEVPTTATINSPACAVGGAIVITPFATLFSESGTLNVRPISRLTNGRVIQYDVKALFPSADDVYVLNVDASNNGPAVLVADETHHKEEYHIVAFEWSGNIAQFIPLHLAVRPIKLGVLGNGGFVIVGVNEQDQIVISLIAHSGQLINNVEPRYVGSGVPMDGNLDIALRSASTYTSIVPSYFGPDIIHSGEDLLITQYGVNYILSIDLTGANREIPVLPPAGLLLDSVVSADRGWFARFTAPQSRNVGSVGEIDQNDGRVTRKLELGKSTVWDVICINDNHAVIRTEGQESSPTLFYAVTRLIKSD